jgi:hypothetical protein
MFFSRSAFHGIGFVLGISSMIGSCAVVFVHHSILERIAFGSVGFLCAAAFFYLVAVSRDWDLGLFLSFTIIAPGLATIYHLVLAPSGLTLPEFFFGMVVTMAGMALLGILWLIHWLFPRRIYREETREY